MLDNYIIIGTVMALVEIVKAYFPDIKKVWYPILVLGLAGLLNVCNAIVFAGSDLELILVALNDGITYGAVASGIYSLGKAALDDGNKFNVE